MLGDEKNYEALVAISQSDSVPAMPEFTVGNESANPLATFGTNQEDK